MRDERLKPPRSVRRTLHLVLGPALLVAVPDGCRETQTPPPSSPVASPPQPAPPPPPQPTPPTPQPPPDATTEPVLPPGTYIGPAPLPGAVPARSKRTSTARPPRRRARA